MVVLLQSNKNLIISKDTRLYQGESCVDKVIVYDSLSPECLEKIDFDILALGEDHKGGRFDIAEKWCIDHGKKVVRLKRTEGICSSEIKRTIKRDM